MNPPLSYYCIPGLTNCGLGDIITKVVFGSTLNNSSACSPNGYGDYTTTVASTDIIAGGANPMAVTVGNGGTEYVAVWIDYNSNGTYEPSEYSLLGSGNNVTINGNINVPASAPTGPTRMRVRVKWNSAPAAGDACTCLLYTSRCV